MRPLGPRPSTLKPRPRRWWYLVAAGLLRVTDELVDLVGPALHEERAAAIISDAYLLAAPTQLKTRRGKTGIGVVVDGTTRGEIDDRNAEDAIEPRVDPLDLADQLLFEQLIDGFSADSDGGEQRGGEFHAD